jgi:hypothetical protein
MVLDHYNVLHFAKYKARLLFSIEILVNSSSDSAMRLVKKVCKLGRGGAAAAAETIHV